MARNWLVNGRTIAKKVKNPTWSSASQSPSENSGTNGKCPNCHYSITNIDDWPGLPAGVKFDPSDAQLLDHLAAKCGVGDANPHALLNEFIPTLTEGHGICYTHPKNLPGVKKDGSSMHFFHRTINAYSTGQRKRRKIQCSQNLTTENVRWHKTGKTKPVIENGVHKGWKKIMVLYKTSRKGCKPEKSCWVMHQYHLGTLKDEEGEFVVSKISYQPEKQVDSKGGTTNANDPSSSPKTPKTNAPPLLVAKSSPEEDVGNFINIPMDGKEPYEWLAGESQAYDDHGSQEVEDPLLCKEILDPHPHSNNQGVDQIGHSISRGADELIRTYNAPCELSDLAKLEFDTPPDFLQNDLPLGSQESLLEWLADLI